MGRKFARNCKLDPSRGQDTRPSRVGFWNLSTICPGMMLFVQSLVRAVELLYFTKHEYVSLRKVTNDGRLRLDMEREQISYVYSSSASYLILGMGQLLASAHPHYEGIDVAETF